MIKPPSAIAPAATTANRFLFIVGLVCLLEALLRAFERDDRAQAAAVTRILAVVVAVLATAGHGTHSCLAQAALHEKL